MKKFFRKLNPDYNIYTAIFLIVAFIAMIVIATYGGLHHWIV